MVGNIAFADSSQDLSGAIPNSFHFRLSNTEYFGLSTFDGNSEVKTGKTLSASSPANSNISLANSYQLVDPELVA